MGISRRQLLFGALGGLCASRFGRLGEPRAATGEALRGAAGVPRKLVIIYLSGGPDGVLTMDPKTPREVEPWVDNPLLQDNVQAGNVRLGALWSPLKPWAENMAIVHGVQAETANHFAGTWQLLRLRRRGVMTTPGFIDLVARHRDSPLGGITVGVTFGRTYTPSWLPMESTSVMRRRQGLALFDDVPASELEDLASVLREHEQATAGTPGNRDSYGRVATYLESLPAAKRFQEVDWKSPPETKALRMEPAVVGMQRVLWAFEHDMASTALVYFGFNKFDSHWENTGGQTSINKVFVAAFQRFLTELDGRRNEHGTLAEQTTVIVSGELGRFPRMNSDGGKDHLPEMSMMFMGAGIQTGAKGNVIGQTGRDMMGLPVDLATGKPDGKQHIMLDDVGGTMLRLFGIEPSQYGYPTRPIEPLIA